MSPVPSATDITVREVLAKLDAEFATTARALANGEFALWVGSGISRKAPNLGDLIAVALEHLRARAIDPATESEYMPALDEALALAGTARATLGGELHVSVHGWTMRDAIVGALWNRYSHVLDIRLPSRSSDFILWEAIDIRSKFAHPVPPAAQHLCIAILVLEGAVKTIASGNWDGFIEAAVHRLGGGVPGLLQAVVDPNHLRGAVGKAKLLKFHGCIVHADAEPDKFRQYLTGSHTQIMEWPEKPLFAAMRNAVLDVATHQKSMVLGLSIQDVNLQGIFTRAKQINPWPWPCAPEAPGQVFCEDVVKPGQIDVLKVVYGEAYNDHGQAIRLATHMRAWAEQMLIALVLKMVTDKLAHLMEIALALDGKAAMATPLAASLRGLRDVAADAAAYDPVDESRTLVVNRGIEIWSRALSVFRLGCLPRDPSTYEAVSPFPLDTLAADHNAQAAGLGRLGIAVALLEHGRNAGRWSLSPPTDGRLASGVAAIHPMRPGGAARPLFLVKSASEAIRLQADGAFANDNAVIIHSDEVWHQMIGSGSTSGGRRPRGAPGRTGVVAPKHVSLGELLRRNSDMAGLQNDFSAKMTL